MKKVYLFGLILCGFILFVSCNDDETIKRDWPRVKTLPVTNISDLGAEFKAEITYRGDFEILRYGFVWSQELNPTVENSEKVVFTGNLTTKTFSAQITTSLGDNILNHVRSFVETSDYLVYGKEVQFTSLGSKAPKIKSFKPLTGTWGDTISISGQNFSYIPQNNVVKFGELEAGAISSSDTLIKVKVPEQINQNSVKVKVSVQGNTAISEGDFNYLIPEITSIAPLTGTFLDTITIYGINFGKLITYNTVYLGSESFSAEVISASPTELKVVIPLVLQSWQSGFIVRSVGYQLGYAEPFILLPPVIESFGPGTVTHPDAIINIYGKNFNPVGQNNIVQIDGLNAEILSASGEHLTVRLPSGSIPNYRVSVFNAVSLSVSAGYRSGEALSKLNIHWESTWTKKNDFPGTGRHKAVAFSVNGKGYFGTGFGFNGNTYFNDFWEYDPVTDQWSRISDFPGLPRAAAVSFMLGEKGYVGTGSDKYYGVETSQDINHFKDFYSFDPVAGTWTRVADFQGIGRHSAAGFVRNNAGYLGTGHWGNDGPTGSLQNADDFWRYDPVANSWTAIQNFPEATSAGSGFNTASSGFVYDYNKMYEYDGTNWIGLTAPVLSTSDNLAFSILGFGYFGLGGTPDLWKYDPVNQSSENIPLNYTDSRSTASVFVIGNKAYVVGGISPFTMLDLNDVWEFDPAKPAL